MFYLGVTVLGDGEQQGIICICNDSELLAAFTFDCTAVEPKLRETQRRDLLF